VLGLALTTVANVDPAATFGSAAYTPALSVAASAATSVPAASAVALGVAKARSYRRLVHHA
jgi:uncharacterized membrane protein